MSGKIIILVLLLFIIPCLKAYSVNLLVENYSTKDGLSDDGVQCILQDSSRGYLWVGTHEGGLCRYDGNSFKPYKNIPNDTTSISGNNIYCLAEDHKGNIWIGTDKGLNCYNYNRDEFFHFEQAGKLGSDNIRAIAVDKDDVIWVGTQGDGLYRLQKTGTSSSLSGKLMIHQFTEGNCDTCISDNIILAICFDRTGRGWIGTHDGICVFQNDKNPIHFFKLYHTESVNSIGQNEIFHFACDSDNSVWALGNNPSHTASMDRITLPNGNNIDVTKIKVEHLLPQLQKLTGIHNPAIQSFYIDKENSYWLCFYQTGLLRFSYSPPAGTIIKIDTFSYGNSGQFPSKTISAIYQRHNDIVWFGSDGGLSKLVCSQKYFQPLNCDNQMAKKLSSTVCAFDDNGNALWLGGDRWVAYKDSKNEKVFQLPGDAYNAVRCITFAASGDLLVGSLDGLYILKQNLIKPEAKTETISENNAVLNEHIFCFVKDQHNRVWIGSSLGLKYLSDSGQICKTLLTDTNSYPEYYFQCMVTGDSNSLWIGSQKGLWHYNTRTLKWYSTGQDEIRALCLDHDTKKLWMATAQGIKCYNTIEHHFEKLNSHQNFMTASISNIIECSGENLWFTTNAGLIEWNPRTNQTNYFSKGIPLFANGESSCILAKQYDGTLLAINGNGIYTVNPNDVTFNNDSSHITITNFTVRGNSIFENQNPAGEIFRKSDTITLDPDQNTFAISFVSLNYVDPEKTEYVYSLVKDGDSVNWSEPQLSAYANYPEVNHGTYVFHVKDLNGNDQKLGTIIIKPHFYETIFFYFSVILFFMLLGGLIFFIFYRVRLQRILLAQRIRNKIASDLHDDIGSSLNSINVYSEIVKRSLNDADPKTMRAVESMGTTSRQMIDNMSDIVWAINQKNDDFEQILQRMKHFAGELLAEKHIGLHFNFDERVKKIKLPMEKRKSFYLIYKEAINNAYKYSHAQNVDVQLQLENNELNMIISDDGKGFDDVKTGLGGNGLRNMKARADEVKARLEIKSCAGKGTQVYLNLHAK